MAVNKKLLQGATAGAGGLTPSEHFGVVLYEGDGSSSHSINGGKFGAGAATNGSNSNLTYPEETFDINKSHTVSGWVNLSVLANEDMLFYNHDTNVRLNSNYSVKYRRNLVNTSYDIDSSTTLSTNTWYHIVFTFSTTSGMTLYINGSSEGTDSYTGNASVHSSDYGLMYRADNGGQRTKGKIDQVRIFTKALSSSEVSTLYAETVETVESLDPLNVDTTDTLQVLGDTSCTALYRLENNEDDKSGNYNGTGTQVQYAAGRYGQGAIFSDSDSKINIPDNFGAEGETVSYSLWFKTTSANGSYMFAKRTGNNTFHIRIDNSFSPAGKICVNNWAGTAQSANNAQSTNGGYNDGGWHHFVFTYDGNQTTKTKCFIDGVYDSGMDWTYDLDTQSVSGGNNIGNYDLGSSNFSGTIDQVRVFNKTLSASEVTTLYEENSLVASYRFEGNANDDTRNYDGTASNVTYEYGLGFTPDLVWIKNRTTSGYEHFWWDSTRGAGGNKSINSDSTNAEGTENTAAYGYLSSFDTGGFTLTAGTSSAVTVNKDGDDYVAWCFKANGGTTSSNTDGSITSTVQVNEDAGFSLVKYDGANISGSTSTVGHGLGAVPELIIVKTYETGLTASEWFVYSQELGNTKEGYLNQTAAFATDTGRWNSTSPTSSVFTLGSSWSSYPAYYAGDTIAYCFHSVENFSSFGSYTGNNSLNGPIVETGFEPAFVMVKTTDGNNGWAILDNKRNLTNRRNLVLFPNSAEAEYTASGGGGIDFLSNGFQVNSTEGYLNANGETFIYMAFAADPDTEAPTVAKSFAVKTYTGTGAAQSITGTGFLPNLVWIKDRDTNFSHALTDSVRGVGNIIKSNSSDAQSTDAQTITSFDSDGFSIGTAGGSFGNNGDDYVAWTWKADDNEPTIFGGDAIAIYKFEDNANDVTGTYNGTASNVTFGTGKYGNCAIFNGTNSQITTSYNPDDTKAFTWSSWINVTNVATDPNDNILGTMESSAPFNGVAIFLDVNDIALGTGGSNRGNIVNNVSTGTWYHVAVTYNGNGTFKTYKDGSLVSTISQTPVNGGNFWFGDGGPSSWNAFDGKLDQIRLYEELLSDQQINNLYNETVSTVDDIDLSGGNVIVSANANAGFSIVKWEGSGTQTQILHGLSAVPEMILSKRLDSTNNWSVYHKDLGLSHTTYPNWLYLNLGSSEQNSATAANHPYYARPSSTVIYQNTGTSESTNVSGADYISYCFHSVSSFSKIGSYSGNGSTGQTITTGFQPDFVIIKSKNNGSDWYMIDSVRPNNKFLVADGDATEYTASDTHTFVSTGFTLSGESFNNSGYDWIYMAFKMN